MTRRLSEAALKALPDAVERPGYDRSALRPGVIHLGLGAFHRAHQAVAWDDLARAGDARWGVVGVSMRSADAARRLAAQDGLYTLSIHDGGPPRDRVVGCLIRTLSAPDEPDRIAEAVAGPDARWVTLTVTENGYGSAPGSAADLIARGLSRRRGLNLGGLTLASCDNLPDNGTVLRGAVLEAAARIDEALPAWIEAACAFPQTMVDRITPATTQDDVLAFERRAGVRDEAVVRTEPFSQWVIEDRFAGDRPDLASVGVRLTAEVAPWEAAKLRLLNGAHSAVAYLGGLAGAEFVHEVLARPGGRALVEALWDENAATLPETPGMDVAAYRRALMDRLADPALRHRLRQIAMDGSLKLPPRLLTPIALRLERGLPVEILSLAVAAWIRWLAGRTDAGESFALQDPLARLLVGRLDGAGDAAARVDAVLSVDRIFPRGLAASEPFRQALIRRLSGLERGAGQVLADLAGQAPSKAAP